MGADLVAGDLLVAIAVELRQIGEARVDELGFRDAAVPILVETGELGFHRTFGFRHRNGAVAVTIGPAQILEILGKGNRREHQDTGGGQQRSGNEAHDEFLPSIFQAAGPFRLLETICHRRETEGFPAGYHM